MSRNRSSLEKKGLPKKGTNDLENFRLDEKINRETFVNH